MTALPSQALMTRETRVALRRVPHGLGGVTLPERSWQLEHGTFLMRGDGEHYLHYRCGEGIAIERGNGAQIALEPLWLAGSVHAAVACLNGMIPIHASAVVYRSRVHAFTGRSGAGKSTLVAALGARGLPMFCDDTLVLDPSHEDVMCLPGHKRLKLTREAAALTGAQTQEPVDASSAGEVGGKLYALPAAGDVAEPMPLASLVVIEDGERLRVEPLTGGAKVRALLTDHYTLDLLAATHLGVAGVTDGGQDDAAKGSTGVFERMSALAARTAMVRLVRPRDVLRLDESATVMAEWIRRHDRRCRP